MNKQEFEVIEKWIEKSNNGKSLFSGLNCTLKNLYSHKVRTAAQLLLCRYWQTSFVPWWLAEMAFDEEVVKVKLHDGKYDVVIDSDNESLRITVEDEKAKELGKAIAS